MLGRKKLWGFCSRNVSSISSNLLSCTLSRITVQITTLVSSRTLASLQTKWQISYHHCKCYSTESLLHKSTIYAVSSGFGKCGVSIIRVSGKCSPNALLKLTKRNSLPGPRKAIVQPIYHPVSNLMLDRSLVLWFPRPNSFTGEDVCEFQVHGGPAVIASVLNALSCVSGLRPAEAGDYTKQAFLNGKLDLTEVEGLGDLIHAETEAQRRQALHQMEGSLASLYKGWSNEVLRCVAHLEAFIDFEEDEDLDPDIICNIRLNTTKMISKIQHHLSDERRGERLRDGVRVAIIGKPNVGKSSLLNAVTQRPAAIVSPIPGTTRDVIETALDISGFPVLISDTAGLRRSHGVIEKEGVDRAYVKAKEADLVVLVVNSQEVNNKDLNNFSEFIEQHAHELHLEIDLASLENLVVILNKSDLLGSEKLKKIRGLQSENGGVLLISCKTLDGFQDFLDFFSKRLEKLCGGSGVGETPSVTQQRHRLHLNDCVSFLEKGNQFLNKDVVIAAEYLRMALTELGRISGKIGSEDILDVIFKDFCIGK
ncbi:5-taurinomethyluridine-[tRNA] synthase subunit GTPB3, mitochondrial [Ciona intestinalis]